MSMNAYTYDEMQREVISRLHRYLRCISSSLTKYKVLISANLYFYFLHNKCHNKKIRATQYKFVTKQIFNHIF